MTVDLGKDEKPRDPEPDDRVWVRHHFTGDLGYLVTRDDKKMVKFDRTNQDIVVPYKENEWDAETKPRALTRAMLAQVAFDADKSLLFWYGQHGASRRQWTSLTDTERVRWIEQGPQLGTRKGLYLSIMGALSHLTKE